MADLIDRLALGNRMYHEAFEKDSDMQKWDSGCWIRYKLFENVLRDTPSVDAVEVVRCKDCKHRFVNEHYGEKGYMKIKAMCSLDTDDPFELGRNAYDDDWFCADGERKDE